MSLGRVTKDPDAVLPYRVDWTAWLAGATIQTSTWVVPAGLTASGEAIEGSAVTVATLSGGVAGTSYEITNRVVTSDGRTDDRSFTLRVLER